MTAELRAHVHPTQDGLWTWVLVSPTGESLAVAHAPSSLKSDAVRQVQRVCQRPVEVEIHYDAPT